MISTCTCQHCGQSIEFDVARNGEIIACPTCGKQTKLIVYIPISEAKLAELELPASENKSGKKKNHWSFSFGYLFLAVSGAGFILNGCALHTESVMHQIYAAQQYTTGFILLGLAFVLEAVLKK